MKREKILERVERESSYLSDEKIMIENIRGYIRMTQYELTMIDVINFK